MLRSTSWAPRSSRASPPPGLATLQRGKGDLVRGQALTRSATIEARLYPDYDLTATLLRKAGLEENFASSGPLRSTHRRTPDRHIYFVANRSAQPVDTTAALRVSTGAPQSWDPLQGTVCPLLALGRLSPVRLPQGRQSNHVERAADWD